MASRNWLKWRKLNGVATNAKTSAVSPSAMRRATRLATGRGASSEATSGDRLTSAAVYLLAIARPIATPANTYSRRSVVRSSRTEHASATTIQNVITTSVTAKWLSHTWSGRRAVQSPASVAARSEPVISLASQYAAATVAVPNRATIERAITYDCHGAVTSPSRVSRPFVIAIR